MDLIERLEAQVPDGTPVSVCRLLDAAAAELRTLRADLSCGFLELVGLTLWGAAGSCVSHAQTIPFRR